MVLQFVSVNGLVNYSVPNSLKETKIDGIIQFTNWITDGHIETGGDDSISVTLLDEKLFSSALLEHIP